MRGSVRCLAHETTLGLLYGQRVEFGFLPVVFIGEVITMSEAEMSHWAADKHSAQWSSRLEEDLEYRTYWVSCARGGIVSRTTGKQWRCLACRVRMVMVFRPRHYDDPQDVPLHRRGGDAVLVGFFDEADGVDE